MSNNENGSKYFDKMVQVFNTTGKVFSYWHDSMSVVDRKDVCHYLEMKEFSYAGVLDKVAEKAYKLKTK